MTEKLNSDAAGVLGWRNAVSGHDPYLPTITLGVGASINVTAEQLAEGFWSLGSDQIAERAGAPNYDHGAMNGFQTMLSHAQDFHDSAAEIRASDAKRHLAEMARLAKRSPV